MQTIHFILQGKGGVGKTLISSFLMQYLQEKNKKEKIMGVDTDPNNSSFTSIKALNIKFLPLLDEHEQINERNFDNLIELFFNTPDTTFVIDNGATSFLPLIGYLVDNAIFEMLQEKFKIIIHIPVTGGQSQNDTLNGMDYLIKTFNKQDIQFMLWVNEYFGKVLHNEQSIEELPAYINNKKHIQGVLYLPQVNPKTYGIDLEQMTKSKSTFSQVMQDKTFTLMSKQRLKMYKENTFNAIELLGV